MDILYMSHAPACFLLSASYANVHLREDVRVNEVEQGA
jgi:hypothetical protein